MICGLAVSRFTFTQVYRFVCCSFHMNVQKYIFFIGYQCNDLVTYFVHSAMRNVILHVDKCLVIVLPSICIFLFDFISLLTYIWSKDPCVVGRLDHTRRTYRCWEIVIPSLFPYIGSEVRIWIHRMNCNKYQDSICSSFVYHAERILLGEYGHVFEFENSQQKIAEIQYDSDSNDDGNNQKDK